MLQEETSYFDLEDIEKMRQVALGNLKQVKFELENITLICISEEELMSNGETEDFTGEVTWQNQEQN